MTSLRTHLSKQMKPRDLGNKQLFVGVLQNCCSWKFSKIHRKTQTCAGASFWISCRVIIKRRLNLNFANFFGKHSLENTLRNYFQKQNVFVIKFLMCITSVNKVKQIFYRIKGWVKLLHSEFLEAGWIKQTSLILTAFSLHQLI